MKVTETSIAGVYVAEVVPFQDHRGAFSRVFCQESLSSILEGRQVLQANHSITKAKGAIRGLHFQKPPYAEMKLVRCLSGSVFDVAVDLRKDSPTYLKHHAEELSAENGRTLIIPEGCAHGFQTLTENCTLLYFHTALYNKDYEGGLRYNDPDLEINWPLPVTDLSERDKNHPFSKTFKAIDLS